MTELLTAAQMRAIEEAAIASGEVTGLELMERAGRGVVEAIFEEWPELKAGTFRAVVLCGPGNNGGDGFVVARLLKEWGWEVEVFLYGDPERLPPDARVNYERWRGVGEVRGLKPDWREDRQRPDLIIDALFGTGLARPIESALLECLRHLDHRAHWKTERSASRPTRTVAVDIRSGVCADSGKVLVPSNFPAGRSGDPIRSAVWRQSHSLIADLTVAFQSPKIGHFLDLGPIGSSGIVVKNLEGLPRVDCGHPVAPPPATRPMLLEPKVFGREVPKFHFVGMLLSKVSTHKYTHGHALILSGPPGRTGAARLAARGALRIGAGLVTVGAPPEAIPEHAARLDAVMLRPVADAAALAGVLEDARINALCLGPGLGLDDRARGLLAVALGVSADGPPPPAPPHEGEGSRKGQGAAPEEQALPLPLVGRGEGRGAPDPAAAPHAPGSTRGPEAAGAAEERGPGSGPGRATAKRPTILDADALTLLSQNPALFSALHENCVLTPHAGEFARLFPDIAEKLAAPATKGPAYSKVDATREAAGRAGCVVLYKGPDTVIADPSGRCSINSAHYDRAAPWLATAGSGDVLSGFIAGLLARGFAPMRAAETAAWLHVECARKFGPGLIAEDLPEQIPAVFRDLGL